MRKHVDELIDLSHRYRADEASRITYLQADTVEHLTGMPSLCLCM